ncbi:MAG: hypothetical protein JWQ69_5017, partial [Pseudomonas sp.]|nr:hypothetical protein [Pseudomonas sp.]
MKAEAICCAETMGLFMASLRANQIWTTKVSLESPKLNGL